jgi:hypothetical protein
VLSYARVSVDDETVIVSLNMSAQPQTPSLDLVQAGLHGSHLQTLLSSPDPLSRGGAKEPVSLPPYAAWVAELR